MSGIYGQITIGKLTLELKFSLYRPITDCIISQQPLNIGEIAILSKKKI